jgi:hypothetical protein
VWDAGISGANPVRLLSQLGDQAHPQPDLDSAMPDVASNVAEQPPGLVLQLRLGRSFTVVIASSSSAETATDCASLGAEDSWRAFDPTFDCDSETAASWAGEVGNIDDALYLFT